jgi:fused
MSHAEVKAKDKKGALQSGLKVLANILTLGKSDDPNQDITKSSSLPTLLIQLLKNLLKSVDAPLAKTSSLPDLLTDLVRAIALLGKSSFNR